MAPEETKVCPHCLQRVPAAAVSCTRCGAQIEKPGPRALNSWKLLWPKM